MDFIAIRWRSVCTDARSSLQRNFKFLCSSQDTPSTLFNGEQHTISEWLYNLIHICILNKRGREREEKRKKEEGPGRRAREGKEGEEAREGNCQLEVRSHFASASACGPAARGCEGR